LTLYRRPYLESSAESELQTLRATLGQKDEEIARLRDKSKVLNRRIGALEKCVTTQSEKHTWYGYYKVCAKFWGEAEEKLKRALTTLGQISLWIQDFEAKVSDEEWRAIPKLMAGTHRHNYSSRDEVDALLASRIQQLRERMASLQGAKETEK
jgi:hypothetical protein